MKRIQNNRDLIPPGDGSPSPWPILRIALPVILLVWALFKYCYPYADFFTDSYTYINAAANHDIISYRPIGYSVFLNGVHSFSASDTFLVTVQYLLIQSACLYLFFSLRQWIRLSVKAERLLLAFFLLDPLIPYVSNYVSSDALFTGLSLFWIIELMKLINRPTWWRLGIQLILLTLIFFIRFNALFYPVVAAFAFLISKKDVLFKATGLAGSLLVVLAGTVCIKEVTRRQTGTPVFSAFSGWQMANNAMNMYPYLPTDTNELPSPECRELAALTKRYFDSAGPYLIKKPPSATTSYMWDNSSPLRKYFFDFGKKNKLTYFVAWNRVSPALTQYGYCLIRRHPVAFGRYYLWPSAKDFFLPPLVVLATYNEGKKEVDSIAQEWFRYRTNRPEFCSATIQGAILRPLTWLYLITNATFLFVVLLFLRDKTLRARSPAFSASLALVAVYFVVNSGFSIFATPNEFRYQVLPLILLFTFTVCGISLWRQHRRPPP